jgi:hypothetical protein
MEMSARDLQPAGTRLVIPDYPATKGIINHKYIPKTGSLDEADVSYFTFWPHYSESGMTVERVLTGTGAFSFAQASWQELPTLCTVINRLGGFPVEEIVGSELVEASGQGSIANAQIIC